MYGFELIAVWVGIGAAIIYGLKWVYQNAFSHYELKTKVNIQQLSFLNSNSSPGRHSSLKESNYLKPKNLPQ